MEIFPTERPAAWIHNSTFSARHSARAAVETVAVKAFFFFLLETATTLTSPRPPPGRDRESRFPNAGGAQFILQTFLSDFSD